MFDVIILGAGASGLFCWSLLPKQLKKLILEKTATLGNKVLLSGKGRCNFTNLQVDKTHYLGDQIEKLSQLFETFWPQEMVAFLEENGIESKQEENGRILLKSNKSRELVDFFIKANKKNGTEIRTASEVLKIEKKDDMFLIKTREESFTTKKVIIATGGCSFPKIGASNFVFDIAKDFHLKTKKAQPGLSGIVTKENLDLLSGSSAFVHLQIEDWKKIVYQADGNLLFTHWWISGPVVFNASLFLGYHYGDQLKNLKIKLVISSEQMTKRLFSYLGVWREFKKYMMTLTPKTLRNRDEAKVMSWGVLFEEVNNAFECKKIPWLFILWEALNITWETWGFNLQRCWTSAYCCAQSFSYL